MAINYLTSIINEQGLAQKEKVNILFIHHCLIGVCSSMLNYELYGWCGQSTRKTCFRPQGKYLMTAVKLLRVSFFSFFNFFFSLFKSFGITQTLMLTLMLTFFCFVEEYCVMPV